MRISNAELIHYEEMSLDQDLIGALHEKRIVYVFFKRCIDIILSIIAFPIAIIIVAITGILIKKESKGPIIYSQDRVGIRGRHFRMHKLRTMRIDAEKYGVMWAEKQDPRITKVGKFIRRTRIDELPQVINILKGDMSIVGPRPEREVFYHKFKSDIPGFCNRLQIKPGLTGYAQINGGYDIEPKEKLKLDMQYVRERSLMVDMKIILKTALVVFTGDGAR